MTRRKRLAANRIPTITITLPRGLTRAEAYRLACRRAHSSRDFRGFKYDRKTGQAKLT